MKGKKEMKKIIEEKMEIQLLQMRRVQELEEPGRDGKYRRWKMIFIMYMT